MPVRARILDTKFYNLTKNGDNFSDSVLDFSTHLRANVMDVVRTIIRVQIAAFDSDSNESYAEYDTTVLGRLRKNEGNFDDQVFANGDEITVINENFGNPAEIFTISSLSNNDLNTTVLSTVASPTTDINTNASQVVASTSVLDALIFAYGVIDQDEDGNFDSFLTNEEQIIYIDDLGTNALQQGTYKQGKSWHNGNFQAIRIGTTNEPDAFTTAVGKNNNTIAQEYEIIHDYIIPYYNEDLLTNYLNKTKPEQFESQETWKYIFRTEFRRELANPNTAKTKEFNTSLGSVGWYGESYNGFNSDFEIISTEITDSLLTPIEQINISALNKVKIVANKLNSLSSVDVRALFSSLPSAEVYNDNNSTLSENLLFSSANTFGSSGYEGVISNVVVTDNIGSTVEIEFDISFTLDQQEKVSEGGYYVLGLSIQSQTEDNRVSLCAKVGQFLEQPEDVPDLSFVEDVQFFTVNQDPLSDTGASNFKGFVEDSLLLDFNLNLDLSKNAFLEDLEINLVAYNSSTGDLFVVQRYDEFDISSQPVISGVQNINIDENRGYNLPNGSLFNQATIETAGQVGSLQYYNIKIAYRIDWQSWEALINANQVFYNNSLPNNGLNNNASNYSGANGYELYFAIDRNVSNGEAVTPYRDLTAPLCIFDYDESPDDWNCLEIRTETLDGFDLEGDILPNDTTVIKAVFENLVTPPTLTSHIITIRLEEQLATDFRIRDFDTTLVLSGNQLIGCFELDPSELVQGAEYRRSARIDCVPLPAPETVLDLTATLSADLVDIDLNWSAPDSAATAYEIYRSTDGINFTQIALTPIGQTTYTDLDIGINDEQQYFYYVVGNNGVSGSPSNTDDETTVCVIDVEVLWDFSQFSAAPRIRTDLVPVSTSTMYLPDGTRVQGIIDSNVYPVFDGTLKTVKILTADKIFNRIEFYDKIVSYDLTGVTVLDSVNLSFGSTDSFVLPDNYDSVTNFVVSGYNGTGNLPSTLVLNNNAGVSQLTASSANINAILDISNFNTETTLDINNFGEVLLQPVLPNDYSEIIISNGFADIDVNGVIDFGSRFTGNITGTVHFVRAVMDDFIISNPANFNPSNFRYQPNGITAHFDDVQIEFGSVANDIVISPINDSTPYIMVDPDYSSNLFLSSKSLVSIFPNANNFSNVTFFYSTSDTFNNDYTNLSGSFAGGNLTLFNTPMSNVTYPPNMGVLNTFTFSEGGNRAYSASHADILDGRIGTDIIATNIDLNLRTWNQSDIEDVLDEVTANILNFPAGSKTLFFDGSGGGNMFSATALVKAQNLVTNENYTIRYWDGTQVITLI